MPDLVGTIPAGNRILTGIETPKIAASVSGGPLDVSNFFRASALQLQERQLDLQRDQLNFYKEKEVLEFTKDLFNNALAQSANKDGTMFGLDPLNPTHNQTISRINGVMSEAQQQAFKLASSAKGQNPVETARQVANIYNQAKAKVFNDPEYKEQALNQRLYEQTIKSIDQEVKTGKEISPRFYDFLNRYRQSVSGAKDSPKMGFQDFRPDQYVFVDKSKQLEDLVTSSIGNTELSEVIRASDLGTGLPGDTSVEVKGEVQREFDEAVGIGLAAINSDPEMKKYLEATGKDPVEYLVTQIKLKARDEQMRKIATGVEKLAIEADGATTFKDPALNELNTQITSSGYMVNGPQDYEKLQSVISARKDGPVFVESDENEIRYYSTGAGGKKSKAPFAVFKAKPPYPKGEPNPLLQGVLDKGEFTRKKEPSVTPSQPAAQDTTATSTAPQDTTATTPQDTTSKTEDDAIFGMIEGHESSGGTNNVNKEDASTGAATVAPLQFNGALGQKFLESQGITGFDVTKPLTEEQRKELNTKLLEKGRDALIKASRDFFKKEMLPDFIERVKENLPQANIDTTSTAVKAPLYSMAINHKPSGQKEIMKIASKKLGGDPTDEEIINAIQDARIEYVKSLSSNILTDKQKSDLVKRYNEERDVALNLIKNPPVIETPAAAQPADTVTNPFLNLGRNR